MKDAVTDDIATIRNALEGREPHAALDRVEYRLADTEEAAIGYQRQAADQAAETRKWRKRAEQAERAHNEYKLAASAEAHLFDEAQARGRELTDALDKINAQATRHRRATDEHEYLIRDLEFIETRVNDVLGTKEEE